MWSSSGINIFTSSLIFGLLNGVSLNVLIFGVNNTLASTANIQTSSIGPKTHDLDQGHTPDHEELTSKTQKFRIGVVSDNKGTLDEATGKFVAQIREGLLILQTFESNFDNSSISLTPKVSLMFRDEDVHDLFTGFNRDGRGLEFGSLSRFNGKLYGCDDHTGIVYELIERRGQPLKKWTLKPWVILNNPDEESGEEAFPCEWSTVKNGSLWIGSKGTLITKFRPIGFKVESPFIKVIDSDGRIQDLDWSQNYRKMAEKLGANIEVGYVDYDGAAWHERTQSWLFLSRKISSEPKDWSTYKVKSSNKGLLISKDFEDIKVKTFGEFDPKSGFSAVKFIAGTDLILTLRVKTLPGDYQHDTYAGVFDLNGEIILHEFRIAGGKQGDIEFLEEII